MQVPLLLYRRTQLSRSEGRPLAPDDLEPLPAVEASRNAQRAFEACWRDELQRNPQAPSLWATIIRNHKAELFLGAFLRLISDAAGIGLSLVLRQLIIAIDEHGKPGTHAYTPYLYAVALTLCNVLSTGGLAGSNEVTLALFQRIRSALTCMIFDKSLRLHSDHQQQGAVVAMHSTDMAKMIDGQHVVAFLVSPLALAGNMVALYVMVGPAGLAALGALVILLLLQSQVSSRTGAVIHRAHRYADERLRATSEAILGIKVCKFMTWESKLCEKIEGIRAREVAELHQLYVLRGIIKGISHSVHLFMLLAVFTIIYVTGTAISGAGVFPAMSLLNALRHVVNTFTSGLGKVLDLRVTFRRLERFLCLPEKDSHLRPLSELPPPLLDIHASTATAPPALCVANLTAGTLQPDGTFAPLLRDVNLSFARGSLTIIIGATGSGKSTLLSAIVGEARLSPESRVHCDETIAFVGQEAWIMNATLRDNVLMGEPLDDARYSEAVCAAQLAQDLELLPGGDGTEIGERGINLSGGQKARVSIARAVYSGRGVVCMDDSLAALDPAVGRSVFEQCVCGALEKRTRILVTHQLQFLPFADQVVVMRDCAVIFAGTYEAFAADPELQKASGNAAGGAVSGSGGPSVSLLTPSARGASSPGVPQSATRPTLAVSSPSIFPGSPSSPGQAAGKLIGEEEQAVGEISSAVWLWVAKLCGGRYVALCIFVFCLWRVAALFVDLWLGMWSDNRGGFGREKYTEREYFMWFGICCALGVMGVALRQITFNICLNNLASGSHHEMLERLIHAPMSFFDTTPQGRILNRFSKDLRMMDVVISEFLVFVTSLLFLAVVYVIIICISTPYMIVVVGFIALVYWRVHRLYSYMLRAIKRIENVERSPMMAIMSETLGGLVTLRAYGVCGMVSDTHARRCDGMMRALYNNRAAMFTVMIVVALMGGVIIFGASILAIVFVTNEDAAKVSPGKTLVTLGLSYSTTITTVFSFLLILSAEVDASMSAAERMRAYATEVPQEPDFDSYDTTPDSLHPPPPSGWPRSGALEFDGASLRYRDGLPLVLRDVSIRIDSGQKVGIVGRTGSGKSTIMLALFRIVELAHGTIRFDGVDIAALRLADLRGAITIIPQEPLMQSGTVRSNLDPFGAASEAELEAVVRKVGMWPRIEAEGLDAVVADKGANFSVGQRQLLCLARAILKRTSVLLLDEASSSCDGDSDALIQRTIRCEFTNCTVLTIAHRLATVIDSDRILVLDEGRVAEFGSPKELLENAHGEFYSMLASLGEEQFVELYNQARK